MQQGTLFAVPFDLDRLETIGQAVPALEGVAANSGATGGAQLAVSADGTLVYVPGRRATTANPIDWMTRDGKTSVLRAAKADWANPRFSPDGQKLAIDISDGKQRDIWVYEWARDTLTQLTFDPARIASPVWTPDGRRIVFASDRAKPGVFNLYWVNADGTGEVTRLTDSPDNQVPWSWHPSGKFLAFHAAIAARHHVDGPDDPADGGRCRARMDARQAHRVSEHAGGRGGVRCSRRTADGSRTSRMKPAAASMSTCARSPGPAEDGASPRQAAAIRGGRPRARTAVPEPGHNGKIMVAPYAVVGDSFRADTPQIWSPTSIQGAGTTNSAYDLHPDGKRLAAAAGPDQASVVQDKVVFVFNFADYLSTIAPRSQ